MHQVNLKGAAPYQDSTLLAANHISLGIDVWSIFGEKIKINQFIIDQGKVNLLVDSSGHANYLVYQSKNTTSSNEPSSTGMAIEKIRFINTDFHYVDLSIPMKIDAKGFDYTGEGDFSEAVFDLHTKTRIREFSFNFGGEQYVDKKEIAGKLLTQIHTDTYGFVFEKNDVRINRLPVRFKGEFSFLPKGYHIDFKLKSQESTLEEFLSLLPESYESWIKNIKAKGNIEVFLNLIGDYIVEENKNPDLSIGVILENGSIAHKLSKVPLSAINIKMRANLPRLNPDSLNMDLKQFEFKLADGFFNTQGEIHGFNPLDVHATVNSELNLGILNQALQFPDFQIKGNWLLKGKVDGTYLVAEQAVGFRGKKEKVVVSVPLLHLENSLKNGYLKFAQLEQAIQTIEYNLKLEADKPKLKAVKLNLDGVNIQALSNFIKGFASITDFEKMAVNADMNAEVKLNEIKSFYPLTGYELGGTLKAQLKAKGEYNAQLKRVPETNTLIWMKDGYIKAEEYPIPLEQIQVEVAVNSANTSFSDLVVHVKPISFLISGEPFMMKADFKNFNDIRYAIKSKGKLQLEPLYKIFGLEGYNVKGYVKTDVDLAGLQSDALNGNYNRLKNNGKIEIGEVFIDTELLPEVIKIDKGMFSFYREKLRLDDVRARYMNNELVLKGSVDNLINYLTTDTDVLEGKFKMSSPKLKVNDFMAYASSETESGSSGVVLLPENLSVAIEGDAAQVIYDELVLNNFKGLLRLEKGKLKLEDTGFELAGMQANMKGAYQPLNASRAKFNYSIKAENFDIQKAYKEIPLFREMLSSAKSAYGKVSLDYELAGLLNQEMSPMMPSIEGKGTLTLEDIQFKGFKLLNGISKSTGKEGIQDGSVKKVAIKSSIKNNVMTIERTKMKMAGFRPRFEGQVTLDGKMNIGMRLGLPPFGIFGIPMKITGTADNFHIQLGKYKEDDLDEDLDEDDKALYEASKNTP